MAEQNCNQDCRGFAFTLDIPIDAHKHARHGFRLNHEQHSLLEPPRRTEEIRNFQTRLSPYAAPNQIYDLYRKLDALHLYSGKGPARRLQTCRIKRERKKCLDSEVPIGRVSTSEVKRSGAMVRIKYTKIEPRRRTRRLFIRPPMTTSTGGTSLLQLPPEIRCQIYEYLLVCGKVFPYRSFDGIKKEDKEASAYARPTTNITQVSKLIKRESESVLYSRNTFVLPSRRWAKAFFDNCLHNGLRRSYIRSVQVSFSCKDAYMSEDIRTSPKLRDECEKLRQGIKKKYPIRPDMPQSLKDEHVSRYREDTIIRRITDIAWRDKANDILDNFKLDDLTVRFASEGMVQRYIFPRRIWPEKLVIDAFRAGFAFGIPTRLLFEGFDQTTSQKEYTIHDHARQKMAAWTALRSSGDSYSLELGCLFDD